MMVGLFGALGFGMAAVWRSGLGIERIPRRAAAGAAAAVPRSSSESPTPCG
jgi:hypothetical protein